MFNNKISLKILCLSLCLSAPPPPPPPLPHVENCFTSLLSSPLFPSTGSTVSLTWTVSNDSTWVTSFSSYRARFLNIHGSGVLTALAWLSGATWNNAAVSTQVLCTPYNHAPCRVTSCRTTYVRCMRISCNLPPALLAEWLGSFTCYCSNIGVEWIIISQHRKLILEKKILLPPLLQGFEPANFQSRLLRCNHWAIPARLIRVLYWYLIWQ